MKFLYKVCYNLSIISNPFMALVAIFLSLPSKADPPLIIIYFGEAKLENPEKFGFGFEPIFYIYFKIWSLFYCKVFICLSFWYIASSIEAI